MLPLQVIYTLLISHNHDQINGVCSSVPDHAKSRAHTPPSEREGGVVYTERFLEIAVFSSQMACCLAVSKMMWPIMRIRLYAKLVT